MIKTVLTIAGSDPTGGAGIQADLKTFTVIGVYGAAAITNITVQNSQGITRVSALDPDLVKAQIQAVLEEYYVTHIKIGMIGTDQNAQAIGSCLKTFKGQVIYDPVMKSSTGQSLMHSSAQNIVQTQVIANTNVITPNLPELSALTGLEITDSDSALAAGRFLLSSFSNLQVVIVKGGHAPKQKQLTDYCLLKTDKDVQVLAESHPCLTTNNSHGTGCTLASAFAAYHLLGSDYAESFFRSVRFVEKTLTLSASCRLINKENGKGPLLHYKAKE